MGILKNFEGDGHDNEHIATVPPIELITNAPQIRSLELPTRIRAHSSIGFSLVIRPRRAKTKKCKRRELLQLPWLPSRCHLHRCVRPRWRNSSQECRNRLYTSEVWAARSHKETVKFDDMKTVGDLCWASSRWLNRPILVCFLLNLARDLEEDFAEVNIHDLVETSVSAFAQLLLNKSKMKVRERGSSLEYLWWLQWSFFPIYSFSFPYLEVLSNQGFYPLNSLPRKHSSSPERAFASGVNRSRRAKVETSMRIHSLYDIKYTGIVLFECFLEEKDRTSFSASTRRK